MTYLRTIAPLLADFALVPGTETRDPVRYAGLWAGLSRAPGGMRWTHTSPISSGFQRYRSIADDSLRRTLHVGEATLDLDTLPAELDHVRGVLAGVEVRLFDHGVALVEATFDVDAWRANRVLDAGLLDELQDLVVAATTVLARHSTRSVLTPAVEEAREWDSEGDVIAAASSLQTSDAFGEALWVSRALVLEGARSDVGAISHWLKDTELEDAHFEELVDGTSSSAVQWLNYVYVEPAQPGFAAPRGWEALRYAQYFYSALDITDTRLSEVLARAGDADARRSLDVLTDELAVLSHRAEMIIMLRDDISKYLTRTVRTDMQSILDGWDHDALVREPVKFKVELCDRRLRALVAERAARSALFTDVILLGIAVTSILGTALAITEFGRSSATDPALAGYDVIGSSITQWVAGQSGDTILVVSGALSAVVVLLFLLFRRHSAR